MRLQLCPGLVGESGLAIGWLTQRFSTGRSLSPQEPAGVQRFVDQIERIRGDRRFFFLTCGVTDPDKKACQQKGDPQHGAARVSWQRARTGRIQEPKEIGKKRQSPHRWILRGRKSIEHDQVRFGQSRR